MTKILWIAGILAVLVVVMTCISGCIGQNVKYLVDYGGAKGCYKYARNSYRAGENVVLLFNKTSTDRSYRFYLNGETPKVTYTDKGRGGFQISFVMPAYDVKLEYSSYNTMADDSDDPVSEEKTTEKILLEYQQWNAQGGYERFVYINGSDSSKIYRRLEVYQRETADSEEFKTCYKTDYMNYLACHEVIKEHGLYSWDIRRDTSVDEGLPIVFRYRTLPLIPYIEGVLKAEAERQEEMRKVMRGAYNKAYSEYVCVDAMGNLLKPQYITEHFKVILKQNGLRPIRFHDLRHSCASLMLANGVPMKIIQDWLGHSDMGTTANIYSHLDSNSKIASAVTIENALALSDEE